MSKLKSRIQSFFVILVLCFSILSFGVQLGLTWTGESNTFSEGFLEVANVNATTEYYRNGSNYTAWIEGLSGGGVGNYSKITEDNGASLGPRDRINFIEGENVTLTLTDDASNNQVNVTITATGGGQGPAGPAGSIGAMGLGYTVFSNTSGAYAYNKSTGQIDFSGSDHEDIMNWAMGNLTDGRNWQESVTFEGAFTVSAPLSAPAYSFLDFESARITGDTAGINIIQNEHCGTAGDDYITILGGRWSGGNLADHIFNFTGINGDEIQHLMLDGYMQFSGLEHVNANSMIHLEQIIKMYQDGTIKISSGNRINRGVTLNVVSDSVFTGHIGISSTSGCAWYQEFSGANVFSGSFYLGGSVNASETIDAAMYLHNNRNCQYDDIRIDAPGRHALKIRQSGAGNCNGTQINSFQATDQRGVANTWDAIYMTGDVIGVTISNVYIDDTSAARTGNTWRYGWNEDDAQCNANTIIGGLIGGYGTAPTRIQGGASEAAHIN